MKNRASDFIMSVQKEISSTLVNDSYQSKILDVARNLPMVSVLSYECRLSEDDSRVDFALCAFGKKDGLRLKEMTIPMFTNYAKNNPDYEAWRKVQEFGENWINDQVFLGQFVSALWLNIDIKLTGTSFVEPWVYVIFARSKILLDIKIAVITKTLHFFQPNIPQRAVDQMVAKIRQLPENAHVVGLGIQSSRQKKTLRLVIYDLSLVEISDFLKNSNWAGDHQDFYHQMMDFEPYADSLGFLFDVDLSGIRSLVGIEFYPERTDSKQIEQLLQLLIKRGLCSEIKSNKIMEWVKNSNMKRGDNLEQWVSHVKITYESGTTLEAKTYLYHQFDLDPL